MLFAVFSFKNLPWFGDYCFWKGIETRNKFTCCKIMLQNRVNRIVHCDIYTQAQFSAPGHAT